MISAPTRGTEGLRLKHPARKSLWLKNYDYSTPGAYFITICTKDRKCILSRIDAPSPDNAVGAGALDGPQVRLSAYGRIAEETLREIEGHYPYLCIDSHVIMPNHVHLLVRIADGGPSGRDALSEHAGGMFAANAGSNLRLRPGAPAPTNSIIPSFVSTFKQFSNHRYGAPHWQRSYYDHVIRNENDYRQVAEYIDSNPAKWPEDRFHP